MRRTLTLLALVFLAPAATLYAQNMDWAEPAAPPAAEEGDLKIDDVNAPPGLPDDPAPVPLDGGLTLLGAAGAAYAVRRLRARRGNAASN